MAQVSMTVGAAPSTPIAGSVTIYAKTDKLLYSKNDAGVETLVSSGGSTASNLQTGSGVVSIGAAIAPSVGQVLTATSSTVATWQTPTGGGSGSVTSVTSADANITVATQTTTPVITLVQAPALKSATTTVDVSSATAPTVGQVLTATSSTIASWQTPGVVGTAPAFSAYQSGAQDFSATTWTKVSLQTKEFDNSSAFDNATNFRYTPTTAGYYYFDGSVQTNLASGGLFLSIYKNGTSVKVVNQTTTSVVTGFSVSGKGSTLIQMNGSTDYVELWMYASAGGTLSADSTTTYFQGTLIR